MVKVKAITQDQYLRIKYDSPLYPGQTYRDLPDAVLKSDMVAYPLYVSDEQMRKLLEGRTGVCKGCEWHPNVCDYCLRSVVPDFDKPTEHPTETETCKWRKVFCKPYGYHILLSPHVPCAYEVCVEKYPCPTCGKRIEVTE